jgi:hypothetical protein
MYIPTYGTYNVGTALLWIRIRIDLAIWIRIRIQEGKNDPRNRKILKSEEISYFETLDVLFLISWTSFMKAWADTIFRHHIRGSGSWYAMDTMRIHNTGQDYHQRLV